MTKEEIPKPILLEDLGMMYPTENSKKKARYGLYRCGLCGKEWKTCSSSVKSNKIKSCGCYSIKHGLIHTRLYSIWNNMKKRTLNPKNKHYQYYGGRGINICDEWKNDFKSFYDWAMSNGYSDELSLDRIDNGGNYCPENCRWVTKTIQCRNQRMQTNNTSGYKGVSYHRSSGKYQATVGYEKQIYLGLYPTAEEAGIAYNNYIIENNLEGFILNEIPESIEQCNLN